MADRWKDGPAKRLDRLLQAAGVRNVDLARQLGIDASMVSRYRSGERVPRADDLAQMVERAKGSADEVLGLKPQLLDPGAARQFVALAERVASERGAKK